MIYIYIYICDGEQKIASNNGADVSLHCNGLRALLIRHTHEEKLLCSYNFQQNYKRYKTYENNASEQE